MDFYGKELFLNGKCAQEIYGEISQLPIIDYHCHLDERMIARNAGFGDVGELWLAGDHYKWRAMRLCGVPEYYITGNADFEEKFYKYAEIMPMLAGNPLYYWTHMELSQIFGIGKPLCADTAKEIYREANRVLADTSVLSLLKKFRVEYVATTNDPMDDLKDHGKFGETLVAPTFRPDKLLSLDRKYLKQLEEKAGIPIRSAKDLLRAAESRLVYFMLHGCKIADHGFEKFPSVYAEEAEAEHIFAKEEKTPLEREALFGYLLVQCMKMYARHNILVQLHFAVTRNVNKKMYLSAGADSGFDVIGPAANTQDLIAFFSHLADEERPETVLYTLNDSNLPALCCVTGAFRKVRMGAAWWFNDTAEGIRRNLKTIAEYSALGNNFGMLTDSRSFASYVRFDFFRRILADYLGGLAEKGEYDLSAAKEIAKKISYYNIKEVLAL